MKIHIEATNDKALIEPMETDEVCIDTIEDLIRLYQYEKINNVAFRGLLFRQIPESDEYYIEIYNDWRE